LVGTIKTMVITPDGRMFIGGDFSNGPGIPQVYSLAVWNPTNQTFDLIADWGEIGIVHGQTPLGVGEVNSLYVESGKLIIGGKFIQAFPRSAHTVVATNIIGFDLSSGTYFSLSPGGGAWTLPFTEAGQEVDALTLDHSGNVFAGG